jgi:hypothetical protein
MRKDETMATKKTNAKKTTSAKATKAAAKKTPAKKAATKKTAEPTKKLSQFQAAMKVLAEAGEPMNCPAMVEAMIAKGLWASPAGKTPSQTLYASILRDLGKGKEARFVKADRGMFTLASKK